MRSPVSSVAGAFDVGRAGIEAEVDGFIPPSSVDTPMTTLPTVIGIAGATGLVTGLGALPVFVRTRVSHRTYDAASDWRRG